MRCSILVLICCLAVGFGGCSKSDPPTAATENKPTPGAAKSAAEPLAPSLPIDPCKLLTSEEIATVQGEALVGTKPSMNQAQGVAMYDCFFTLPTFTNSISLSVTQAGAGADARDPVQSWREVLAAANAKAGKKTGPAHIVEGIGDEAFWTGNDRMGALYVLKGARYVRISVGGAGDQASKIEKSRALAEAVLKRM